MKKEIKLPLTRRLDAAVVIARLSLDGDIGGDNNGYFRELTMLRRFLDVDVRFFGYGHRICPSCESLF